MLICYLTAGGVENARTILCITPDKVDDFSQPVPVTSLRVTDCAIHRVSGLEAMTVKQDADDGGILIEPYKPSKLYITPNLHDKPGVSVTIMKILKLEDTSYQVWYIQEGDNSSTWKQWTPLVQRGSAAKTKGSDSLD